MVRKYLLFPAGSHWLRRMLTRMPMQVYSEKCAIFRTGCSKFWIMAFFDACVQFLRPTTFTTSTHRFATSVLTLPDFFPSWAEKEKITPYNSNSKMPLRIDTKIFRFLSSVTHAFIPFITLFIFFSFASRNFASFTPSATFFTHLPILNSRAFPERFPLSFSFHLSLVLYYTRSSPPKQPSSKNLHKILHNLILSFPYIF